MKIVLITAHQADSQRRVDFHFWAEIFEQQGISVDFVTVGFSRATKIKRYARKFDPPYNKWINISPFIRKFMWCPVFHPFSLGKHFLDTLTTPIFNFYPQMIPDNLLSEISDVDLFIVENGAGLMLIPKLAKSFPKAKFIYSVCDRIETLKYHPLIRNAETKSLKYFDLIRVPAKVMCKDYDNGKNKIKYIPHGLNKEQFDQALNSPYNKTGNAVCVGDMLFDAFTIEILAKNYPEWTFHLFGRKAVINNKYPNVIAHGEKLFEEIIPYIVYADIGIAPYKNAPNADYLSNSSMKIIQYTYCRLPVVAPDFSALGRKHVCAYKNNQISSIIKAMNKAISYDRKAINSKEIMDWKDVTEVMINCADNSMFKRQKR